MRKKVFFFSITNWTWLNTTQVCRTCAWYKYGFFLHRSTAHPRKCYKDDYTHRLRAPNGCFCKKKKQTQTNPFFFSFLQSLVAVGAIFGCPIGGWAIDKFGRKRTLLLCSVPFELGWLLISFAQDRAMLYSGRITTGLACGIASVAAPVSFLNKL